MLKFKENFFLTKQLQTILTGFVYLLLNENPSIIMKTRGLGGKIFNIISNLYGKKVDYVL